MLLWKHCINSLLRGEDNFYPVVLATLALDALCHIRETSMKGPSYLPIIPYILSVSFAFGFGRSYAQSEVTRDIVAEEPNILMILVDDLGYSDLGAYGGNIDTSNIDQIA